MNYYSKLPKKTRKILEKYNPKIKDVSAFSTIDYFYEEFYPTKKFQYTMSTINNLEVEDMILIFLHENIFRSVLLYKSFINGISSKNPLQATLASRAQFETCGALTFLHRKYHLYSKNEITELEINDEIKSLLYGIRNKQSLKSPSDHPDPKGVMTLIDSADYYNKNTLDYRLGKVFREAYEYLSEICHPNAYGYILHFKETPTEYRDPEGDFDESVYSTTSFLLCMFIYTSAYENLLKLISKEEEISN
ncbi:hypothetical protein ACPJHQ_25915 [Rossellomorea sp. H39__3]